MVAPVHGAAVIQRKPVRDVKRPDFFTDDKEPKLTLKEMPLEITQAATRKFRVRNQLRTLYWKDDTEDTYFEDQVCSQAFDLKAFAASQPFGSWQETFTETSLAIDQLEKSTHDADEITRRKTALSAYMLNKFISNALYRGTELAVLEYQASPFNYQEKSAYNRSFATSYTRTLQKHIGCDYGGGRLVLTRTERVEDMLSKFFEVVKVDDPSVPVSHLRSGLAKTLDKTADFLLKTDRKLDEYWTVPGNPQAFVDVTDSLGHPLDAAAKSKSVERLGTHVKEHVSELILEQLVGKAVAAKFRSVDAGKKEQLATQGQQMFKHRIKQAEHEQVVAAVAGNKKASDLWKMYKDQYGPGFVTWLRRKEPSLTKLQTQFLAAADNERASQFGNVRNDFKDYVNSLASGQSAKIRELRQHFRLDILFRALEDKVLRIREGVPWVVTSGAAVIVSDPGGKVHQPGVVLDDKTLDMAVKTAVNKSGNVPTGQESSRKLLKVTDLKSVVKDVLATQKGSVPGDTKKLLDPVEKLVTNFDVNTAKTITEQVDHLKALNDALREFGQLTSSSLDAVRVEATAAIKLLKEAIRLEANKEDQLPAFVLSQLREYLEDAVKNQDRIADFVRNIQGIHEIVVLALEWNNIPIEKGYDYGAPQLQTEPSKSDSFFQGAHLTDYGLKAFGQVYDAATAQLKSSVPGAVNIEAFYNIYFELQDKLRATMGVTRADTVKVQNPSSVQDYLDSQRFKSIDNVTVQGPDMVFVDIHPNDATKPQIVENDVALLITEVCNKLSVDRKVTVVVDITLNHTTEDAVRQIRERAHAFIADGRLNLVFVQSLAKFSQLGQDKHSGGLVFAYNNPANWETFNKSLSEAGARDPADPAAERYFQALFKYAKQEQVEYLERVRSNTNKFYLMLREAFAKLKVGSIRLAENLDQGTCYVALRYDEFMTKVWRTTERMPDDATHHFNADVLEKGINTILHNTGLPVAMRFSFGFPISNLGETGDEVRFTIGLESHDRLQEYANLLTYVSGKLGEHLSKGETERKELQSDVPRKAFLASITKDVTTIAELNDRLKDLVTV
jgi:hypothetical protein